MDGSTDRQARQLSLLGMLLLALHVLFGITAIIGVLISHAKLNTTIGTVYHSHLRWQLVTFWIAMPGYTLAAWLWLNMDIRWPTLLVTGFIAYRLIVNLRCWIARCPVDRIL